MKTLPLLSLLAVIGSAATAEPMIPIGGNQVIDLIAICAARPTMTAAGMNITVRRDGPIFFDGIYTGHSCPPLGTVATSGGGTSNWVRNPDPEGTYSPETSGSGGGDSTNPRYHPVGEAPGDRGVNNEGGFAPPPNVTPDPGVNQEDPVPDVSPEPEETGPPPNVTPDPTNPGFGPVSS